MSGGWSSDEISIPGSVVAGVTAKTPITKEVRLSPGGAYQGLVIKIKCSGVTVVGAITATLQSAIGQDWVDSKTVSITANGDFYIKLLAAASGDQTYLPLLNRARVVIAATNAGDAATITSVDYLVEL